MNRSFCVILVALLLLGLVMATAPLESVGFRYDLVPNPIAMVYGYTEREFRHAAATIEGLHLP